MLQHIENTLQHTATRCNTPQHTTTHCNTDCRAELGTTTSVYVQVAGQQATRQNAFSYVSATDEIALVLQRSATGPEIAAFRKWLVAVLALESDEQVCVLVCLCVLCV